MPTRSPRLTLILATATVAAALVSPATAASPYDGGESSGSLPRASAAAPGGEGGGPAFHGRVAVDGSAVVGATVHLFLAGPTAGSATPLSTETTDRHGRFSMRVPHGVAAYDVLYATARGGTSAGRAVPDTVELAAALGDLRKGRAVLDEMTTVAAGYSLAQFAVGGVVGGPSPGLQNAARMPRNLVDPASGGPAKFLLQYPNGSSTETFATFNSLASIIAGCVEGSNDCDAFLDAATDPWGVRPDTTWEAMTLLPTNPSGDAPGVFAQVPTDPRFTPVRTSAPAGWVIALRFYGNGHQFNGPGNVAFDTQGRVWANDNATFSPQPKQVCPGLDLFRLDPYASGQPMETFRGGGLNGAGFGIAIDPRAHVWVSNFGFTGSECPEVPTSNSVSEFDADGQPLSGDDGYLDGPLSWPQGIKSDVDGNLWIASCGADAAVVYPDGDHARATVVGRGISRAFDVAQNTEGAVFVTANGSDRVFGFGPDGSRLPGSPFGDSTTLQKPLGIASDSLGNVWVSNSGVIDIPCSSDETLDAPNPGPHLHGTVAQVGPHGSTASFDGGGLTVPWGIAVDGDDNLWVANFAGERLSHLCGARASTCPTGQVGDPISPADSGYAFDGLQRNTGVQVDPSGNVWLANNWIPIPVQTDPFGDGLVVYLGMAAPVKAPLIGTPERP
jgi:sugar lactone lactonase YvrE